MTTLSDIGLLLETPPSKPTVQKSPASFSGADNSASEYERKKLMAKCKTAAPLKATERHPLLKALSYSSKILPINAKKDGASPAVGEASLKQLASKVVSAQNQV